MNEINKILKSNDKESILALFLFDVGQENEKIIFKYNLWARYFFPQYFKYDDADFHKEMDLYNLKVYKSELSSFVNVAFRGSAKTTRVKLFITYCIANDRERFRRYFKVLTKDMANSKQVVTDIYNMFVDERMRYFYPNVFAKTETKRQETMSAFDTSTGIKVVADTVGTDQRGQIQEESRPDFIWFDDFETRKTLRSAVETKTISDNMEEARTGLSKNGGCIYTCNYISERGNVHKLIEKEDEANKVLVVPIIKDGKPTWNAYAVEEIERIRKDTEDFEGEYLCEPSAGIDVYFDRDCLKNQLAIYPKKTVAGFKIFDEYDPSHRYACGADVGGGVGLDHSTSVFIDFSTIPNRVVATYKNNLIKPDIFGYELINQGNVFGECLIAPENNKFDMVIGVLKLKDYKKIYFTDDKETIIRGARPKTYGWNTNSATKNKMMSELKTAIKDGLLELRDKDLIQELMSYTRDDLMDREEDPRLTTRHFDLLIACAIAWQMRYLAEEARQKEVYKQDPYQANEFEKINLDVADREFKIVESQGNYVRGEFE